MRQTDMSGKGKNSNLTTPVRKRTTNQRPRKLDKELRERFSAYFLNRYPDTKRIKLSMDAQCHYTARAKYGERRTFVVKAYSYETLVIRMHAAYESRGFQPKNNR